MPVQTTDHLHEAPIRLGNLGPDGQMIIIQTGTFVFDLLGEPETGTWRYDRLDERVFSLPPGDYHPLTNRVSAIGSASLASVAYVPPPTHELRITGFASGSVSASGWVGQQGNVSVTGSAFIPFTTSAGQISIPSVGWAVDRTQAVQRGNEIFLLADLAVLGPARLMRLAYTVHVTISPVIPSVEGLEGALVVRP